MITDQEFKEWLDHPVTRAVKEYLASRRNTLMESWANGEFSAAFSVEMAVKNAGATGACSVYSELAELDFEQLIGEIADESVRTGTDGSSGVA